MFNINRFNTYGLQIQHYTLALCHLDIMSATLSTKYPTYKLLYRVLHKTYYPEGAGEDTRTLSGLERILVYYPGWRGYSYIIRKGLERILVYYPEGAGEDTRTDAV